MSNSIAWRLAVAVVSCALIGCGNEDGTPPQATGTANADTPAQAPDKPQAVEKAEAGVIRGRAVDAAGKPLKTFGGYISGYSLQSGQQIYANITGKDGSYTARVGPGQFALRAWVDLRYNERPYRLDLTPDDGFGGLHKHDTTEGLIKNFTLKIEGFRAGVDERSDDRAYGHNGGSIMLTTEGNGGNYWSDIRSDYSHAAEPKLLEGTIEVTLTPDGPLIDGSEGKPVVLKTKPAEIEGYMQRLHRGIPLGRYRASAKQITEDGQTVPVRVLTFLSFKKSKQVEPAESCLVEFIQSSPPSDNVNRVDEVNLHVMK